MHSAHAVVEAGPKLSAVDASPVRAAVADALQQDRTTIRLLLGDVTFYDAPGLGLQEQVMRHGPRELRRAVATEDRREAVRPPMTTRFRP